MLATDEAERGKWLFENRNRQASGRTAEFLGAPLGEKDQPAAYALRFINRSGGRSFDEIDGRNTFRLIPVALGGIGNGAVVSSEETPAPLVASIHIHVKSHDNLL
jgi:hypothetical protein